MEIFSASKICTRGRGVGGDFERRFSSFFPLLPCENNGVCRGRVRRQSHATHIFTSTSFPVHPRPHTRQYWTAPRPPFSSQHSKRREQDRVEYSKSHEYVSHPLWPGIPREHNPENAWSSCWLNNGLKGYVYIYIYIHTVCIQERMAIHLCWSRTTVISRTPKNINWHCFKVLRKILEYWNLTLSGCCHQSYSHFNFCWIVRKNFTKEKWVWMVVKINRTHYWNFCVEMKCMYIHWRLLSAIFSSFLNLPHFKESLDIKFKLCVTLSSHPSLYHYHFFFFFHPMGYIEKLFKLKEK